MKIRNDQKVMLQDKVLTFHFDGKLFKVLTDGVVAVHERCCTLVSSPGLEKEILLGGPKLKSAAGHHQVEGVLGLLEDWEVTERVFSVCCDSTAAQTGKYNGAMTLLSQHLDQPIVWFVCRIHVIELHAKHAMLSLSGPTSAPYDPLFK